MLPTKILKTESGLLSDRIDQKGMKKPVRQSVYSSDIHSIKKTIFVGKNFNFENYQQIIPTIINKTKKNQLHVKISNNTCLFYCNFFGQNRLNSFQERYSTQTVYSFCMGIMTLCNFLIEQLTQVIDILNHLNKQRATKKPE